MVVYQLHLVCMSIDPFENDSKLIIYTNGIKTCQIARKLLKSISRWNPKLFQACNKIYHIQLLDSTFFKIWRHLSNALSLENLFCSLVAKAFDRGPGPPLQRYPNKDIPSSVIKESGKHVQHA